MKNLTYRHHCFLHGIRVRIIELIKHESYMFFFLKVIYNNYMMNLNLIVPVQKNSQVLPIIIHQDSSAFPTNIILDESNYPLWSQLMEMHMATRNKTRYLIDEANKTKPEDPMFTT